MVARKAYLLLFLGFPLLLCADDSHFYDNPFFLVPTVVGTVALSRIAYDFAGTVDARNLFNVFFANQAPAMAQKRKVSVGLIEITGELYDASVYLSQFERVKNDPSIYGLIVHLKSPGGSASVSQHLYYELKKISQKKPVVAFTDNMCCSGAYFIASAASWIIATDMAIVGNIGVLYIIKKFDNEKVKGTISGDRGKVKHHVFKGGRLKDYWLPYTEMTEEQQAFVQEQVSFSYDHFCQTVARERRLDLAKRDDWAQGKAFCGIRAFELGLVDQLGGWSDAKKKIEELVFTKHATLGSRKITIVPLKSNKSANDSEDDDLRYTVDTGQLVW